MAHKGVSVGVIYPAWIDTDLVRDQQRDLASFNTALKRLPWPFNVMTSVEKCASAMVDAIATRRRKTYVPSVLAPIGAVRQLFMSPVWEFFVGRQAKTAIPQIEQEVLSLGRSFGSSSMGLQEPSPTTSTTTAVHKES